MDTVTNTRLWKTTLGETSSDDQNTKAAREKFRVCFTSFREHAAHLAVEIHRHLPDFTVHDITHLDALWEIADTITGEKYNLTPAEGFVLGGAFLLHDLGMGLAAYPGGLEDLKGGLKGLKQGPTWDDAIALHIMDKHNRRPTKDELAAPPPEAVKAATEHLLRVLHAKQAETLGTISWSPDKNSPEYLISDSDIRRFYGKFVGELAHSHWWSVQELKARLPETIGAPSWSPTEWSVDPLKVACILRVADAGHIDERRAPYFLRAIRNISGQAEDHWTFQEKMAKPQLLGDALCYTAGDAFPFEKASAWWLCFDTLRMIDGELRSVDTLLADQKKEPLAARKVAGIESPERLTSFIRTAGWTPADVSVQVSDVPRLLASLGGRELYGDKPSVPLRELVQNSSDAVRARRIMESRSEGWGQVTVRLGKEQNKHWLEVEDNGIGMSHTVLTKYLLDFGATFWRSRAMMNELPGLLSSRFESTGRYGIGFFSVFMLGESVRIRTRRAEAAQKDTLVLEFNTGLSSRPVLRKAVSDEVIRDGGTCVRVWLRSPPTKKGGLLHPPHSVAISLPDLCARLFPALPVTLTCHHYDEATAVVTGDDWLNIRGEELLERTMDGSRGSAESPFEHDLAQAAQNLRVLREPDGTVIGRACIAPSFRDRGVVTVGGLMASRLSGIAGVLTGTSQRASRDAAVPMVSPDTLSAWATEQALLISDLDVHPKLLMKCAEIVRACGGDTGDLPIAQRAGSYLSFGQIANLPLPDEILISRPSTVYSDPTKDERLFVTESGPKTLLYQENWPLGSSQWPEASLLGAVTEAVSQSWGCTVRDIDSQMEPDLFEPIRTDSQSHKFTHPVVSLRRKGSVIKLDI